MARDTGSKGGWATCSTHERLSEHTRVLPPLVIGNCVRLQNLVGPHQTKWDRTGIVVEVRQFDQYVVRVDGSGRITLRNRQYLRLYTPHIARAPLIYSSSIIPIATTGPPAPIQPEAPVPSTPPPGLDCCSIDYNRAHCTHAYNPSHARHWS